MAFAQDGHSTAMDGDRQRMDCVVQGSVEAAEADTGGTLDGVLNGVAWIQ